MGIFKRKAEREAEKAERRAEEERFIAWKGGTDGSEEAFRLGMEPIPSDQESDYAEERLLAWSTWFEVFDEDTRVEYLGTYLEVEYLTTYLFMCEKWKSRHNGLLRARAWTDFLSEIPDVD